MNLRHLGPACLILIMLTLLIQLPAPAGAAPLKVLVSIPPQEYFAQKLGGDLIQITVMVPPGSNPHLYEPKPRQMAAASRAKLYFAVGGMEFEEAWLPRFQAANSKLVIVQTGCQVRRFALADKHDHHSEAQGHSEHDHGHDHKGLDPHIWTAPPNVKLMAQEMLQALIKADPQNQKAYQANYRKFAAEIDALHRELQKAIKELPGEPHLLVYHPSWGYFCRAYGLKQIAVETEGKAPGPKGLKAIIRQAKALNARVVFVQPQFSAKSARMVADAIQGQVEPLDPLAGDWAANLKKVAAALKRILR